MLTDLLVKNASSDRLYVEDVFSTYLYTGNGSSQTITNSIDLSGKGGLVWIKSRGNTQNNILFDTERGATKRIFSNLTDAQTTDTQSLTAFNSTGFSIGSDSVVNQNTYATASWTFRKAPKFFDVVTYTGTGTTMTVSHNLGVVPGMIIVKGTDAASAWDVYHRGVDATAPQDYIMRLSTTAARSAQPQWNNTAPTAASFTVKGGETTNVSGRSYVAYLFAHDTTADGIVQCGSYVGTGSSPGNQVSLGWEPQYLLIKASSSGGVNYDWVIQDNMRRLSGVSAGNSIFANSSDSEFNQQTALINATGFTPLGTSSNSNQSGVTYTYLAIRRGPMRTPTDATKVFAPYYRSGSSSTTIQIPSTALSYAPDAYLGFVAYNGSSSYPHYFVNKLADQWSLQSETTSAEQFGPSNPLVTFAGFQGKVQIGAAGLVNASGTDLVDMFLRRAPSFFDVVCYTAGTSSNRRIGHNLTVAPELIINKCRSTGQSWYSYSASTGRSKYLELNTTAAATTSSNVWGTSDPTTSDFGINESILCVSGATYVTYLFASCPGVSKVGTYTGTGTTQQINCGFTNGARFILIKRTNNTGGWYLWTSVTGIVSGNDPFMLINQNTQISPSTDYIDPYSAGFEISSSAISTINGSGDTFIYLAIA